MRRLFIFAFVFSVLHGFSQQTNQTKLEELQKNLDELNHMLGQDSVVEFRKIRNELDKYESIKHERDSLLMATELLKAENLLLQSKINSLTPPPSASVNEKGSFVVLLSSKDKHEVESRSAKVKKAHPEYEIMIIENNRKTWFHACLVQSFGNGKSAGEKLREVRNKGFEDAWWIKLD